MHTCQWTLEGSRARLACGPLAGRVDLRSPRLGLHDLVYEGRALPGELLGVDVASAAEALSDSYQRGGDLVATYEQTPERPIRVQTYWRAGMVRLDPQAPAAPTFDPSTAPAGECDCPFVDLVVSAQTRLLNVKAMLDTLSCAPPCEPVWLEFDQRHQRFSRDARPAARLRTPGCVLFRLGEAAPTYVEMIHPDDLREATLMSDETSGTRHQARLFDDWLLEKGVILRARLRGVFVPRAFDEALAAAALADFARRPPPLTT